ncbi:MAG TPA: dephospho-CoA kinase [Flavobacteriia bacterium]|nr:dephospho-CoA kinase [Flavobacteriia bacterium]
MLTVGLTGGIGSGKTTVAKMFEDLGIPVYYADDEGKKLMYKSKYIKRKLTEKFGNKVYENEQLNRPYLANIIFNDKNALKYVSKIVHPRVAQHFKRWLKKQNTPYAIQENAILFENDTAKNFDKIILVTAPIDTKIDRVIKRDNTSKEQVLSRMNNQLSDNDKISKSDFTINNTDKIKTQDQVKKIHQQILTFC